MPLDRGTVEQQLQAIGEGSRWWEQLELRDLPDALHANENIRAIAVGAIWREMMIRRNWLIVVTDQRMLALRSGRKMMRKQLELTGNDITRVSMRMGPFNAQIKILASGSKIRIKVKRPEGYKLLNALSLLTPRREEPIKAGLGSMAGRVIQHVLDLPTAALHPGERVQAALLPAPDPMTEQRIQALEDQVQRLQQQVDFLEALLRQRELVGNEPIGRG